MAIVLVEQTEAESLFNQNLAKLLKELRGKRSLREFADLIGANHVSLRLWESGKGEPRMKVLSQIAVLKCWTLDELMVYLEGGASPKGPSISQLLAVVQSLPLEGVAQVAAVAVETLASRSIVSQIYRKPYSVSDESSEVVKAS